MEGDVMDKLGDMASVYEFDPITGNIPATKVEITVSCRNLLDKDTFSKSDPLCVLYTQGVETKQWREFGRTEVIDNTLNPDFVRKYILDYFFEEKQNLRFDLYDVDSKSPDLSKHDFLGQVFCTLGEIVGSPASRLEKPLGTPLILPTETHKVASNRPPSYAGLLPMARLAVKIAVIPTNLSTHWTLLITHT
ncbi:copine-5 isoform X3 [Oncorhynchus keta]|uniref:copine-5 isoform X3 n=1 Tax=Oncorhynchus keta TaxID=8018 RepID=UPI00227C4421|nr:copine-5 isoform X3 [Oncorhynchus keta]